MWVFYSPSLVNWIKIIYHYRYIPWLILLITCLNPFWHCINKSTLCSLFDAKDPYVIQFVMHVNPVWCYCSVISKINYQYMDKIHFILVQTCDICLYIYSAYDWFSLYQGMRLYLSIWLVSATTYNSYTYTVYTMHVICFCVFKNVYTCALYTRPLIYHNICDWLLNFKCIITYICKSDFTRTINTIIQLRKRIILKMVKRFCN